MTSSVFNELPFFISDEKTMAEYEEDVLMRSLPKEKNVEAIVSFLGKQKHPIKEKLMTSIGEEIKNNDKGLENIWNS